MTIEIDKPIYNGSNPGKKCVGIADWRLRNEGAITQIKINQLYKTGPMKGKRIYPTLYFMPTEEVIQYPTQTVGNNTLLYIVPIDDMKPKKFDLTDPQHYQKEQTEIKSKVCHNCGSEDFWEHINGTMICRICHPPVGDLEKINTK